MYIIRLLKMKLYEDIQINETLNPKLWDIKSNKLKADVRAKIVEIVTEFEKYIEAPIDIVDIHLVGSNASYNYTDKSDLDVHVIANFDNISDDKSILQMLYNVKKANFNRTFDISLHGVPIELYIEDINSVTVSNGIYSVCDDKWIKAPKRIPAPKKVDTSVEVEKWKIRIESVIKSKNYTKISDTLNFLYLMRHNSIAVDGEYGKGNQIFKDIRNLGLLGDLKDALNASLSKKLTLEHLDNYSKGQLVNSSFVSD